MSTVAADFYVIGGTLRRDAPSYVKRQADDDLYEGLSAGQFCYVLTSRQMGKSSLMVRAAVRLRADGVSVAVLDLTALGQNVSAEQWYQGLLGSIGEQLNLEDELEDFWRAHKKMGPLQRWMSAIREVVMTRKQGRVVIFVDEIDAVRSLPFATDEFFAAIRELYNRRTEDSNMDHLTFCLLGVAAPSDLIRDTRTTPFNIGERIELQDFSNREAEPLAQGLGHDVKIAARLLERVLYWTDGHPYLSQRFCQALAEDQSITTADGVDRVCQELFLSARARERDDNLIFVRERVLRSEEADRITLLDLYLQIRKRKRVPDDEANAMVSVLRLSGIARVVDGNLRVRNRIYYQAFDQKWVQANMPDAELQRQRRAYRKGQMRAAAIAAIIITVLTGSVTFAALGERNRAVGEKHRADQNAEKASQANGDLQDALKRLQAALGDANRLREIADRKTLQTEEQRGNAEVQRGNAEVQRQLAERQTKIAEGQKQFAEEKSAEADKQRARAEDATLLTKHLNYGANINLAKEEWEASNISGLVRMLNNQRPKAVEEDLRGLEWSYYWRLAHGYLWSHEAGETSSLRVSPDGQQIASLGENAQLRLWYAKTGQELPSFRTTIAAIHSFAFTNESALYLAEREGEPSLNSGGVARQLTIKISRLISDTDGGGREPISEMQIDPNPTNQNTIKSFSLSENGTRLLVVATISNNVDDKKSKDQATVWDVQSGKRLTTLGDPEKNIARTALSPDGGQLATANSDGDVDITDAVSGKKLSSFKSNRGGVSLIIFSPDGSRLATSDRENVVTLWDALSGTQLSTFKVHDSSVKSLAFSPDGRQLGIGNADRTASVWDAERGEELMVFRGHEGAVTSLSFSAQGDRLITGSGDKTIKTWEVAADPQSASLGEDYGRGSLVVLSADGNKLATAGHLHPVKLWDIATRKELTIEGGQRDITSLAISPDGQRLATGGKDKLVKIWDVASGKELLTLSGHEVPIRALAFSPDGNSLATGSLLWLRIWDAVNGSQLRRWEGHSGEISSVVFSPDGKSLATGSTDSMVRVWQSNTGEELLSISGHNTTVTSVTFSTDGKRLASGSNDSKILVSDPFTGKELLSFTGHEHPVSSVVFSPDGKRLFTGAWDDTLKIWDSFSGRVLLSLNGRGGAVTCVAVSSDGKRLAAAIDGRIRVLDYSKEQVVNNSDLRDGSWAPGSGYSLSKVR